MLLGSQSPIMQSHRLDGMLGFAQADENSLNSMQSAIAD